MQRSALCRARRELSNAYLLGKFGFDAAENEPFQVCPLSAYRSPRFDSNGVEFQKRIASADISLAHYLKGGGAIDRKKRNETIPDSDLERIHNPWLATGEPDYAKPWCSKPEHFGKIRDVPISVCLPASGGGEDPGQAGRQAKA